MLVFAVRILEGMFLVGALGCVLVLVLTTIDDIRVLFSRDDDKHRSARSENAEIPSRQNQHPQQPDQTSKAVGLVVGLEAGNLLPPLFPRRLATVGQVSAQPGNAIGKVVGLDVALPRNASNRELQAPSQFATDPVQRIQPRTPASTFAAHYHRIVSATRVRSRSVSSG
jgi:hypothetical protein